MNGLDFVRDNRDIIKEKILNFYNLEKYNVVSTVVGIMLHASNASVIMGIHGKYSSEFSSRKSSFIIDTTNCKHLDHYVDRARTLQINSENASMCELGNMTFQPESNAAIFEGQTLMIANEKRRNCIPDSVGHPLPTCGKLTNQNSRCFLQLQTIQFVDHFRRNRGETITRLQCFDMHTGAVVQKGFCFILISTPDCIFTEPLNVVHTKTTNQRSWQIKSQLYFMGIASLYLTIADVDDHFVKDEITRYEITIPFDCGCVPGSCTKTKAESLWARAIPGLYGGKADVITMNVIPRSADKSALPGQFSLIFQIEKDAYHDTETLQCLFGFVPVNDTKQYCQQGYYLK